MNLDLNSFTPDQLQHLKTALDGLTADGRSQIRERQLHDLRLAPTASDPRPTFFWSAESPRNASDLTKTKPYPRLMWHGVTGQEITVTSKAMEQSKTAEGFVLLAPANAETLDPTEEVLRQLEQLSPEDQAVLVAAAQKDRLAAIQAQMASLSDAEMDALKASLGISDKRKRKSDAA